MVAEAYAGENKNVEFKREIPTNHEKFLKDIIAFSNSSGGKVILGVEDGTHTVYGIGEQSPFKLSDSISNMISDACTPQIEPDISIQTMENKTVLVIDVVPGKFRPYYIAAKGKETTTYVRINGTSRPADRRKIQELELEGQNISYDSLQEIGKEYDEEKALDLCKKMKHIAVESCKTEEERASIKDMTLEKLEDLGILCKVGRNFFPTHAFELLTDNKGRSSKVQCALFKGRIRDVFIDKKEFRGPIYEQVEDAYQFVLRHIDMGTEIEGIYRSDSYELPISAIREMIANAIVHRSYLDKSCIQVCIFDDRIEVLSPGMLYGGLDLETAKLGKSTCRNEAIAEAFHYMHIIEAWGTGIPRIINKCKEYGLPEPLFEEFGDGFKVTMFRKTGHIILGMYDDGQEVSSVFEEMSYNIGKVSNGGLKIGNAFGNVCNDGLKVSSAFGNVCNDGLKVSSAFGNVCNDGLKVSNAFDRYLPLFHEAEISKKFIANIENVFAECGVGMPFGQANVMEWLECSKSKATNVMNAMKAAKIIEKVTGLGPGKYKFIEL